MLAAGCQGPPTCPTFLGIEVDTVAFDLRLPEKLGHSWRHGGGGGGGGGGVGVYLFCQRHTTPMHPHPVFQQFCLTSGGGLAVPGMAESVLLYFQSGITASTRNSGIKQFYAFCRFTPFPVYEQLLCSFVAYLADEGLSPQTAKSYLAAVRNVQLSPDPCEALSLPILGCRRALNELNSSVGGRLGIACLSQRSCWIASGRPW